ncbi:MAG: ribosome small subunit-dependent GTPase A [bacterium]
MKKRIEGLVVRVTGKEIWVQTDGGMIPCLLRGRFRRQRAEFRITAGDRVEVSPPASPGSPGAVEAVRPRRSWLSRFAGGREAAERVIVANVDLLFVIESIRSPGLSLPFLDRVLVSAECGHIEARICVNKVDLVDERREVSEISSLYAPLGYPVVPTSAKTGEGLDVVEGLIEQGIYAFVGRSGVGKSSLLNQIEPDLDLPVGSVAEKTGRGRHTTTYSQLFPLKGGHVADTPGMQTFGYPGTSAQDLPGCFPELRNRGRGCRFQPCTHSHEPDCDVKEAVEAGEIAPSRYQSYLSMLAEVEAREKNRYD